jgi:predicted chitinase
MKEKNKNATTMPNYSKAIIAIIMATSIQNGLAADPCALLTQATFNAIAPDAVVPYTYSGFCTAVTNWNTSNPSNQIFMGATEADQRAELAAFFGNIRHESDDLKAPREYYMCQTQTTVSGTLYCKPSGYSGGTYNDPYCSSSHTSLSIPAGCDCSTIPESTVAAGYIEANLLFLGRGALQLSWNYNYYYAGAALGVDLCTNPDRVATEEAVNWGTAMWFWTTNTGATGTTCKQYVAAGSFGGTVKTIVRCFVGKMNGLRSVLLFSHSFLNSYVVPSTICELLLHRTVDWNAQLPLVITTR